MKRNPWTSSPNRLSLLMLVLLYGGLLGWMMEKREPMVFLFFLVSIFLLVLDWRMKLQRGVFGILLGMLSLLSLWIPHITFSLIIYVLYSFSQGTYLLGLLPSVFFIYDQQREGIILWGIVAGMAVLLSFWRKDQELQWRKEYQLRKRLYEQEEMETLLLHEQKHLENMSRLKERQRIAEVLHDELGHELTAAHLSLKAARTVAKEEEGLLVNTLDKSLHRLEAGLTKLKEAVRQIEPTKESFLDTVETLKKECTYPVTFTHEGDLRRLEPYQEQLVFGMIKEGFTNIEKHANPSEVEIHVAILETVLRVRLYNDGVKEEKSMTGGNGLRYLRKRLEAVGGTVSSQKEKGAFTLLMVLPLRGGNEDD